MKNDELDNIYQSLLDEEKGRISVLPTEDLRGVESFTCGKITSKQMVVEYGFWHETPKYDSENHVHSFVLKITRRLFFGIYRNYLAGFSLDDDGNIIPITDEVLCSYD